MFIIFKRNRINSYQINYLITSHTRFKIMLKLGKNFLNFLLILVNLYPSTPNQCILSHKSDKIRGGEWVGRVRLLTGI